MSTNTTNPIEVSLKDTQLAFDLLRDSGVTFTQESSNEFLISDSDEWNDTMEMFADNNIEVI